VRFPKPILLLLSALLALTLSATASTAAPAPVAPHRAADPPRSERAGETLAAVQAAFAGGAAHRRQQAADGRDVTLLLVQLRRQLDDLGASDRQVARSFLARPTDANDPHVQYSRAARATSDCKVKPTKGSHVCVHWARATHHAPPMADRDRDKLPNQVERTRNVANAVWDRVVTQGGYRKPPRDNGGPNRKLDIYLANIGASGLYGYCVNEDRVSGRAYTGYCVLDDDYSPYEFGANTPTENLKVTVAHEFFHVVQFGYDAHEALWFMEGSAAWIEDEIYDSVNDNHIYLPTSPLAQPGRSLDRQDGLGVYGSWIFWRFLTERYAGKGRSGLPLLMRRLWGDVDHLDRTRPRLDVLGALRNELADRSTSIPEALADFAVANRRPVAVYEEGASYQRFVADSPVETVRAGDDGATSSVTVNNLASQTIRFLPHDDLGRGRTLELTGTLPADAAVRVTVASVGGGVRSEVVVKEGPGGWKAGVADFDTATTEYVELTLVNGGVTGAASLQYKAEAPATP
jgi:hypothetical protein